MTIPRMLRDVMGVGARGPGGCGACWTWGSRDLGGLGAWAWVLGGMEGAVGGLGGLRGLAGLGAFGAKNLMSK